MSPYTRDHLLLRWDYDEALQQWAFERMARFVFENSEPAIQQHFMGTARGLDAQLIIVRSPNVKRAMQGLLFIQGQEATGFLQQAEVSAAINAPDLQTKGQADDDYWSCQWVTDPSFHNLDPYGNYLYTQFRLEEK